MEMTRRNATLMAMAAPLLANLAAAGKAKAETAATPAKAVNADTKHIAMLIYPELTILDMIGPQFVFSLMPNTKVHLVAKTKEPFASDSGVIITPTATFEECPKDLTVLFTGGGSEGTFAAMKDEETIAFMADRGARAQYVTSVCTGALILGTAGLLKGYKATTHWGAHSLLSEFGAIATEGRVVRDRNRFTGGGVTAGIDFGLTLAAELYGEEQAQIAQLIGEYDPHPPFNAGTPKTAPADIFKKVDGAQQDLVIRMRQFAKTL